MKVEEARIKKEQEEQFIKAEEEKKAEEARIKKDQFIQAEEEKKTEEARIKKEQFIQSEEGKQEQQRNKEARIKKEMQKSKELLNSTEALETDFINMKRRLEEYIETLKEIGVNGKVLIENNHVKIAKFIVKIQKKNNILKNTLGSEMNEEEVNSINNKTSNLISHLNEFSPSCKKLLVYLRCLKKNKYTQSLT